LVPSKAEDILELDELWSFVGRKANKRWIWIALCRRTRQIVSYFIGDRSLKSCWCLWHFIPNTYRQSQTFSDFWDTYEAVFGLLGNDHQSVGKETGQTAHVERWNNTLRQRLARFVRRTLSFSKSDEYHKIALQLFVHEYNLNVIS
jgi:insertion element IS1 protein InsB